LIERVNKLDADQAISLELEITMFLLGISDYPSVEEALRGELGQNGQIANEATVRQAVKDVDAYILSKAPAANDSVKKVEIKTDTETENLEVRTPTTAGNLHDILYKELEVNKKTESVETKPELDPVLEIKSEQITTPEITEPVKPLDFYREKIGDEDKKVKTL
jgi:hypothetical protein